MIEIDIDNRTIKGNTTAKEIKEKGLIKASIEHEVEDV